MSARPAVKAWASSSGAPPVTQSFGIARCVLHFHAGKAPILIPGRIAWSAGEPGRELDLGIRFDPALALASSRELYSSWIVASILSLRDYVDQQS